ncbi:hypothetical protein FEDK69T_15020 [Flavobacterium enshiense DK69]|nr:hypothetical protein [Flavobacterium enshiense]ESU23340.1 hypothetical protein FEDK69T_15020 [Flavobacterium enshiense DK69]
MDSACMAPDWLTCLVNAVSVAGMIPTKEYTLVEIKEENAEGGMPGMM